MNSFATKENRYRLFVLPISKIGPGTDTPSATSKNSLSFPWTTYNRVTFPCLTDIFIDNPFPLLLSIMDSR